jgi:hypothetical protein
MTASTNLFDAVVEASGLVELIAPFTISRLLVAADVSPQQMTEADLQRALPELQSGLAVYLGPEQLEEALANLRRLARV